MGLSLGSVVPSSIEAALNGEGWRQIAELGLALLLSAVVGFERELRQKSAGLRTHTLVGVGAAVFMLISKYGFTDVLQPGRVILDPSRVAAQIVTGVGFLGAGIIFVRRDSVHGLTTAAAVWLTAAIGACAGAGLPILASTTTGIYLVVATVFAAVTHRLPSSSSPVSVIRVRYLDGRGTLRRLLEVATARGFVIDHLATEVVPRFPVRRDDEVSGAGGVVELRMEVRGRTKASELTAALSEVEGVEMVAAGDLDAADD